MFTPPTYAWKLWYEDGSTFSSEEGEPWESPVLGVCLLAQPKVRSVDILASRDYLIYREDVGHWMEVDIAGLFDQQQNSARHITCFRMTRLLPSRDDFAKLHHSVVLEVRGK